MAYQKNSRHVSFKFRHMSQSSPERLFQYLRQRHGNVKWAEAVEGLSGVSAATLKKCEERGGSPSLLTLLKLVDVYGLGLLAALYDHPPAWLDEAKQKEELTLLNQRAADLTKQIEGLTKNVGRY